MNKRIKKKQEVMRWRKEYKAIKKRKQRKKAIGAGIYRWGTSSVPKFKKWKERIIFMRKISSIFGIFGLKSALMPNTITNTVRQLYKFGGKNI
jgi:hypothetical protein